MSDDTAPADRPPRLARWASAVGAWGGLVANTVARTYLVMATTLCLAAAVPVAAGWQSSVVSSGSMRPALEPGDVVAATPVGPADTIVVGRVMTFVSPVKASTTLVHRVVSDRGDGTYTTAGDANHHNDSTPLPRRNLKGLPRLRIPWIGLPLLWRARGDSVRLALWAALTLAALEVGRPRRRRPADEASAMPVRPPDRSGARPTPGGRHHPAGAFIVLAMFVVGLLGMSSASAAGRFSGRTLNAGNVWSTTARVVQPYNQQVLADLPSLYYLVDEAAGPTAADASGFNRAGTYGGSAVYRQPNGLPQNPGYAVQLAGNGARLVSGGPAVVNPTVFSLELWFKTATKTGGKLIGFESTQGATSATFDRYAFMGTDGRISYGGSTKVITTAGAYNDNAWHHLVVTSTPDGTSSNNRAVIYVDGVNVAAGNSLKVSAYSGWWRAGFGSMTTGVSGYPATADFAGTIDNVAVYTAELSATRVAAHYAAR